jgi:hydroxymethylbilane synthase
MAADQIGACGLKAGLKPGHDLGHGARLFGLGHGRQDNAGQGRLGLAAHGPDIAQGVIGIECRRGDSRIERLIAGLNDANASAVVAAERALNARLQGGCQVPIAGHATLTGDQLEVRGLVASLDGLKTLHATRRGHRAQAHALGVAVAEALLADGAGELLAAIGAH